MDRSRQWGINSSSTGEGGDRCTGVSGREIGGGAAATEAVPSPAVAGGRNRGARCRFMSPDITHLPLPGDDLLRHPRPSRELRGDGFGFCTEILGSESCEMVPEEARVGEKEQPQQGTRRRLDRQQRTERREFPPPIRWLQMPEKGEMRAERKDGRLIVREVRINREAGIFRVQRQDGRLRLFLSESEGFPDMGEVEKALEEEEEEREAVQVEDGERWEWPRLERWRRFADAVVSGGREAVQLSSSNFTTIA